MKTDLIATSFNPAAVIGTQPRVVTLYRGEESRTRLIDLKHWGPAEGDYSGTVILPDEKLLNALRSAVVAEGRAEQSVSPWRAREELLVNVQNYAILVTLAAAFLANGHDLPHALLREQALASLTGKMPAAYLEAHKLFLSESREFLDLLVSQGGEGFRHLDASPRKLAGRYVPMLMRGSIVDLYLAPDAFKPEHVCMHLPHSSEDGYLLVRELAYEFYERRGKRISIERFQKCN